MISTAVRAGWRNPLRQSWMVWAALIPVTLVVLPVIYIFIRTAQLGAHGAWAELFRVRNLELLLNTLILAGGVTALSVFFWPVCGLVC